MTRDLALTALTALAAAGCGPAIDVEDAALRGSLGEVEGFDQPVEAPSSYTMDFGTVTRITLDATDEDGRWALGSLELPADFVGWAPGRYRAGQLLGCSTVPGGGPMFDRDADEVDVLLEPGDVEDEGRLSFTGTWRYGDQSQQLSGTFDYRIVR